MYFTWSTLLVPDWGFFFWTSPVLAALVKYNQSRRVESSIRWLSL